MEYRTTSGTDLHFLDFSGLDLHAIDDIWKECHHVVIAHCHVCDDLLEGVLLEGVIFVLLSSARQLLA